MWRDCLKLMEALKKYLKKTQKINIFTFSVKLSLKVFSVKASVYFTVEEKKYVTKCIFLLINLSQKLEKEFNH